MIFALRIFGLTTNGNGLKRSVLILAQDALNSALRPAARTSAIATKRKAVMFHSRAACIAALLCLLGQASSASASSKRLRTSPDVAEEVKRETQENFQIHESFQAQEEKDVKQEQSVKKNPDLQALQLNHTRRAVQDPCANIKCAAALSCPGGFTVEKVPGHCCSYCVNPAIDISKESQGATGSSGGAPSTFCDDVWCFPTMCTGTSTNPTTTNGLCCSKCEA